MTSVALTTAGRAWSSFRIALILMLSSIVGMAGVLAIVSNGIDAHQAQKEEGLVRLRLARSLEGIGADLTTGSVWDEAVQHMATGDAAWFDQTLGRFYAAQHNHPVTLGYDASGRMFRAGSGERPASAAVAEPFARAAQPLVDQLRHAAQGRDRGRDGNAAVTVKSAFVQVGGQMYVLGASTLVRHTATGPVPPTDPAVASFKPFGGELDLLRTRLSLTDVHFQPGDAPPPRGLSGVEVRDVQGALLGRVVWAPERPGHQILTTAGPLLLLLLATLVVGTASLLWNTRADVRRLRASEAALSAALDRAEAANQAKTRFLSNVSHELRTPLNGVLGMAEVIGADAITPQQRERLEILKASGRQQLRLVEELLDVVRLRDGAIVLESRPFRPDNLLQRVANDFDSAAATKGLALRVEAVEGEWLGDPVHIEKLLAALADNAVRFTRTGHVTLRALAGDDLVLEVEDTGPGMTADEVTRLFDAFTQGDESSTRTADGLGLGLTAAHGLAVLMGGRVEVVSTPGAGSLFRVPLPLARA